LLWQRFESRHINKRIEYAPEHPFARVCFSIGQRANMY